MLGRSLASSLHNAIGNGAPTENECEKFGCLTNFLQCGELAEIQNCPPEVL